MKSFNEAFAEVKALLNDPPPSLVTRATGSTGTNPVQDSTARGIIAAALSGVLVFLQIEFDLISANGVAALAPVVILCAFIAAGLWDRYGRPRLT